MKRSKDVTVIAVAERRFEELAVEAVREGADGYIIQPFAANDVLSLVQKRT
ncbi:MAG: hypothetical protein GX606_02280 [Elusimicrobia bacterium]|nr:hypothetical protein [Elusimicrobiota bacterium]